MDVLLSFSLPFSFKRTLLGFCFGRDQSCLEKGCVGELKRSAVKLSYNLAWMTILGSKNMKGKSDLVVRMEKMVGGL